LKRPDGLDIDLIEASQNSVQKMSSTPVLAGLLKKKKADLVSILSNHHVKTRNIFDFDKPSFDKSTAAPIKGFSTLKDPATLLLSKNLGENRMKLRSCKIKRLIRRG
jgi:hypothetical protein